MNRYVPEAGEIVWLHFDPQAGHEQAGHRPALVLSSGRYNQRSGLMICCPMTSRIKGNPFEVIVAGDPPSAVLADQVKSMDWRARRAKRMGQATPAVLAEARALAATLIEG